MKAIPAAIALFAALPAAAEELEPPDGAVMLTVTGKIGHTNRLAFHPLRDKFVAFHERGLKKAAEFDREMLESLGMSEAHIEFDGWNGPVTFRSPRLIAVLKKVGWHGAKITTLALDGFGTAISKPQIDAHNWILATRGNDKPFDIGQRGQLWLVLDPPGDHRGRGQVAVGDILDRGAVGVAGVHRPRGFLCCPTSDAGPESGVKTV